LASCKWVADGLVSVQKHAEFDSVPEIKLVVLNWPTDENQN